MRVWQILGVSLMPGPCLLCSPLAQPTLTQLLKLGCDFSLHHTFSAVLLSKPLLSGSQRGYTWNHRKSSLHCPVLCTADYPSSKPSYTGTRAPSPDPGPEIRLPPSMNILQFTISTTQTTSSHTLPASFTCLTCHISSHQLICVCPIGSS